MRFVKRSGNIAELIRRRRGAVGLFVLACCLIVAHQVTILNDMEALSLEILSAADASLRGAAAAAVESVDGVGRSMLSATDAGGKGNNVALRDDLVREQVGVLDVWKGLIEEGSNLLASGKNPGAVLEVGMHRAFQCLQAANAGLQAYCVEPSPTNFVYVKAGVREAEKEVQSRVHLYNVAAGETSEGTVPFSASGSTGDHVGQHDMWKMESTPAKGGKLIHVPSKRMDDVVQDAGGEIFLLKVDTQGFEPAVFSGLTDSLSQHKVKYVIFEYWPRGMDLLAGEKDSCIAAKLLQDFADMGYTLYALDLEAHPKAPLPKGKEWYANTMDSRPLDNAIDNCRWYFKLEELYPSEDYKMGYWSDIVAVAPGASLEKPTSDAGRILAGNIKES